MFYLAEAVLLTRNLSYSKHQGVISAFGEHFVKTGLFSKKFSKALTQAFEKRQLSEYEAGSFLSKEETEEILKKAEEFFETVSKYLGSKASG